MKEQKKKVKANPLEILSNFLICGTMQLDLHDFSPTSDYHTPKDYIGALQNQLSVLGYRADCMSLNNIQSYLISIKPKL